MKTARTMTIIGLVFLVAAMSACQTMTGRSAGRLLDDNTITGSVKAELTKEKAANLTRIGVNTTNGVVYLTGVVETFEEKARAEAIAQRVDGVKHVQNDLQVRTTPAASPRSR